MRALQRNPLPLVVKLQGGLGNQLFQICFGVDAQRRLGRTVIFETSFFSEPGTSTPRDLEVNLNQLGLRTVRWQRLAGSVAASLPHRLRILEHFPEAVRVADLKKSTLSAVGYFQTPESPLRTRQIIEQILAAHCPVPELSQGPPVASVTDFVAVHIRLGDYSQRSDTRAVHGLTDPHWSLEQARIMAAQINADHSKKVNIRIFTDGPGLLGDYLGLALDEDVIVDTSLGAWEVLSSMRQAKGIVMCNSSLSWWAAFISTQMDGRKIPVIMPSPWFSRTTQADKDLYVDGWSVRPRALL